MGVSSPIPPQGRQRWRDGELGVQIHARMVSQGPLRIATRPDSCKYERSFLDLLDSNAELKFSSHDLSLAPASQET